MNPSTITIEALSNDEGILACPFRIDNKTISELGLYKLFPETSSEIHLWVVPTEKKANFESSKISKSWIIISKHDDSMMKDLFFMSFEVDSVGDCVKSIFSTNKCFVYNNHTDVVTAAEVIKVLHPAFTVEIVGL